VKVVSTLERSNFTKSAWLSGSLLKSISDALAHKEQSLVFLNRRGSARIVLCQVCGWQALCPKCDIPFTYHGDSHSLRCHSCGTSAQAPPNCPECQSTDIVYKGIGTKAIVEEINRLLPKARVQRFDTDNIKAERFESSFKTQQIKDIDILVGTQVLSKSLDLTQLSTVGVVNADSSLVFPDFSANERTFELLTQVTGRVGRGHRPGRVVIQTHHPESPLIKFAINKDYECFYEQELLERKQFFFPPFCYLLKLTCKRATQAGARKASHAFFEKLRTRVSGAEIIGPMPKLSEKSAGFYHWQIVVKARKRSVLTEIIKTLPAGWSYDVDPLDLL
jgi:primosomal protein N' (replication factor Y)